MIRRALRLSAACLCLAFGAAAAAPAIVAGEGLPDGSGHWRQKLQRYVTIARRARLSGVTSAQRQEALRIVSYFRELVRSPAFRGGMRHNHDRRMARAAKAEKQAQNVLLLVEGMDKILREGAGRRRAQVEMDRKYYMGNRDTVLKLLSRMELKMTTAREARARSAPPAAARHTRAGAVTEAPEGRGPEMKKFIMHGHYRGYFPNWDWEFLASDESDAGGYPYAEADLAAAGLKFPRQAGTDSKGQTTVVYRYRLKDEYGLVARETPSQTYVDPKLAGTPFTLRGLRFRDEIRLTCDDDPEDYRSAEVESVFWKTRENCAQWVRHWRPMIQADRADPRIRMKIKPYLEDRHANPMRTFRMTYYSKYTLCGRPAVRFPRIVEANCVDGDGGVYTISLDATKDVFKQHEELLENVLEHFSPIRPEAPKYKEPPLP